MRAVSYRADTVYVTDKLLALDFCRKLTSHTTSHDSFSLYLSLEISVSVVLEQELHHSSTTLISC